MEATTTSIITKDFIEHFWKQHCRQSNQGSTEITLYFALRAICTKSPERAFEKYMKAHFQPITNAHKLMSKCEPGGILEPYAEARKAVQSAKLALSAWIEVHNGRKQFSYRSFANKPFIGGTYAILTEDSAVAARTLLVNNCLWM
jgi:hypothetical protein